MRIEIAERLRPFSHLPGTSFVLPGSFLGIDIFPVLIRVKDLAGSLPIPLAEIALDLTGPIKDFTALQDLEKGSLRVWGKSADGYFRFSVKALEKVQGIAVSIKKAPADGLNFKCTGKWTAGNLTSMTSGDKIVFAEKITAEIQCCSFTSTERLSLGSHKLQDWELVRRRLSFTEIFPIWFCLGQMIPQPIFSEFIGTAILLTDCQQAIAANAPEKILVKFRDLFLAGFEGILSPRLADNDFQGIKHSGVNLSLLPEAKASAMSLVAEGAKLIRSLFVQEDNQTIHVLPAIPPEFHCGRMLNVCCGKQGLLNLEWTKKSMRCMTFSAIENQKIAFTFSNHEKKCRLRSSYKERGIVYIPGSQLDIVAGQSYWFDNFQR